MAKSQKEYADEVRAYLDQKPKPRVAAENKGLNWEELKKWQREEAPMDVDAVVKSGILKGVTREELQEAAAVVAQRIASHTPETDDPMLAVAQAAALGLPEVTTGGVTFREFASSSNAPAGAAATPVSNDQLIADATARIQQAAGAAPTAEAWAAAIAANTTGNVIVDAALANLQPPVNATQAATQQPDTVVGGVNMTQLAADYEKDQKRLVQLAEGAADKGDPHAEDDLTRSIVQLGCGLDFGFAEDIKNPDANALGNLLKAAREAVTVEELTDDEKARRAKKAEPYSGERQAGARNRILNAPLSPSELSRREGMKDAGLTEGKIETIERGSVLLDDAQKAAYIAALGLDEEKLEAAIASTKAGIAAKAKPAASAESKAEAQTQGSYLKAVRQATKANETEKKGRARESMRAIDTLLPEDAAKRIGVQLEVYKAWESDKTPVPADKFEATQKAFGLEDGSKLAELSKALETAIADRKANIARIQARGQEGGKTQRG